MRGGAARRSGWIGCGPPMRGRRHRVVERRRPGPVSGCAVLPRVRTPAPGAARHRSHRGRKRSRWYRSARSSAMRSAACCWAFVRRTSSSRVARYAWSSASGSRRSRRNRKGMEDGSAMVASLRSQRCRLPHHWGDGRPCGATVGGEVSGGGVRGRCQGEEATRGPRRPSASDPPERASDAGTAWLASRGTGPRGSPAGAPVCSAWLASSGRDRSRALGQRPPAGTHHPLLSRNRSANR